MMAADWIPRSLPGGIYCSPLCGGRCKKSDFDRVTREAAKLAKRLGDGWEPRVWENLGWFYDVAKGALEVHPPSWCDARYSAWLQKPQQFIAYADTPEDAIGFVVQDVRTFMRRMEDELRVAAA